MVATTQFDKLKTTGHTLIMNERRDLKTEMPQQELRFTARDPILDEALASFEKAGQYDAKRMNETLETNEPYTPALSSHLFLYAMKRITIDTSDTFDGTSQNYSLYLQYRKRLEDVSLRGTKRFHMAPWVKPLYVPQQSDTPRLVGLGLGVVVDPLHTESVIDAPLYEGETLAKARAASTIPVRYELQHPIEETEEVLERLEGVLSLGVYAAHMTLVAPTPRNARENIIFQDATQARTYQRVGEYLGENLPSPIVITPNETDTLENAS